MAEIIKSSTPSSEIAEKQCTFGQNQNRVITAITDNQQIIDKLDAIINLLQKDSPTKEMMCDISSFTFNLSLLQRTIKSLTNLSTVCTTISKGVINDFTRARLIMYMAHVSDNLVDLVQEFNITGQDLRDADHDQSDLILNPVYPKPTTCEGHCNCNNKKG